MPGTWRRILREPLLHFLLLGAALFVVWKATGRSPEVGTARVEVSGAEVEALVESWRSVWQRPPTAAELDELVQEHVREEILYREALELGLHRGDPIIRRRLRQKMELIAEDAGGAGEPTAEELEAFFAEHPELFAREARLSFRHVYVDRERRGASAREDATALLERLRSDPSADLSELGDPLPLPAQVGLMRASEIRRLFGERFTGALEGLPTGRWSGPVESDLGLHLVGVDERIEMSVPPFDAVRGDVEREWLAARQRQARERYYERLRDGYEVVVPDLEPFLDIEAGAGGSPEMRFDRDAAAGRYSTGG